MGSGNLIIPDINLLVYAYDSTSPLHSKAAKWWVSCLSGSTTVGLPWVVALGFIRLWTNPKVFARPMTADTAAGHVESWIERRNVRIVSPGPRHAELLFSFLRDAGRGGNLTTDAHLAALAVELGATVHTSDADFARFPGLKWKNPLN